MESKDADTSVEKQRAEWSNIRKYLTNVLENIHNVDSLDTYKHIFDVNIVFSKNILIHLILTGHYDPMKLALLVSNINIDYPEFGKSLVSECIRRFVLYFKENRHNDCYEMLVLLSQLYNYDAVHLVVILYTLQSMSEEIEAKNVSIQRQEISISLICVTLMNCGKKLLEASEELHNQLLDQLRELLQINNKLSSRVCHEIEEVIEARQQNYQDVPMQKLLSRPFNLDNDEDDWTEHAILIFIDSDFLSIPPNFKLNSFNRCDNYDESLKHYNSLHKLVIDRVTNIGRIKESNTETVIVHNMTDSEATEFKKRIYLTLKSSLSGDEAAHKLLKLRVPDHDKHSVADIIERSLIQETTYSKFYGLIAERLLETHKSWLEAFREIFYKRLETLDELEPNGIRNSGKFWGHLLSTDLIGFEILSRVTMTETGSTAPLRIFVKFIFQEIVFEIGINELRARLDEEYIQPFLSGIFPKEEPDDIRYSINYFTAINLGILTEGMRRELQKLEVANETSSDDDDDEEEEEEEEEHIIPKREEMAQVTRQSRYQPHQIKENFVRETKRRRSITPPRRQANNKRRRSVTPPRRTQRS